MSWLLRAVFLKQVLFCFTGEASSHSSKQTVHSDRWEENYFSSIKSYENCFSRWVLLPNYDKGAFNNYVDKILPNFDPHTLSSGQKFTFYILSTLCHVTSWTFYWPLPPLLVYVVIECPLFAITLLAFFLVHSSFYALEKFKCFTVLWWMWRFPFLLFVPK